MNEDFHVLTGVIGITGMGKSWWVKNRLIGAIAEHQPIIILDKQGEYGGENAKDIPRNSGWKYSNSVHSFLVTLRNNSGIVSGVNVIDCNSWKDYDYAIKFIRACDLPVCIILEESHFIFDEKKLMDVQEILKQIARFGRKKNMSMVLISQRLMDIPKDIRTQFLGVVSFRQNDSADVDSLRRFDSKAPEKIIAFGRREYEIFGEVNSKIEKKINHE